MVKDNNRFITSVFRSGDPEDPKHYVKVIDTKGLNFCFYVSENKSFSVLMNPKDFPKDRKFQNRKTLDPKLVTPIVAMLSEIETNPQLIIEIANI